MPALRTDQSADTALIERTRRGDRSAYGELWQRHAASARTVARSYSSLDPDDLVAESFTRIYDAILAGGGPTGAFRPYLFTTIRNTASSWGRARRETNLETLESFEDPATSEAASLEALDRSTTAQAFRSLPTRWQEVLWYAEVEGMTPQQLAPLVGMSANSTAALAYRAREGLRQAWIQAHLRNAVNEPECRWTIDRLGSYTRGRLRTRETTRLEAHLDDCARCTIVAAEAREVGSRLALVLLPLAAGVGGATAYSAWLSQGAPAVDVALGAAGLPAALGGVGGTTASTGAAGSGSSAAAGASAAAVGGTTTAGVGGVAIGAGVGALVLAAAAVAAVVVLPALTASPPAAPPAVAAEASAEDDAMTTIPDAPTHILPQPVPPAPLVPAPIDAPEPPPADDADAATPDTAVAPAPAPAPAPATPPPAPDPEPEPVDTVALPPTVFTPDTAGGLVDPLLSGTAEPGAAIVVSSPGAKTWATTAGSTGEWLLTVDGMPVGVTVLSIVQTDAAGNRSASAAVTVELAAAALTLHAIGPVVYYAEISGVPGALVEVHLNGHAFGSFTLDANGFADSERIRWLSGQNEVTVRYVVGSRVGPLVSATRVGYAGDPASTEPVEPAEL
ncbi:sigma-70 family RNA polymerase sigma factor [Agromyces ramosus]|uniref:RNA polymerase sigma factor (Sigma-70 family) n=1 Tax=Agromyces ramosus TaxID=33879 RepID=A0ABU0R4Y3_9MICO|nr:sigma-70 family RNA polymerase sigma factor [Agromyces ramosus]MDQ0893130.1 RNA polymerase sigma factor (sigma-70 family) [Agromyces ramosus]